MEFLCEAHEPVVVGFPGNPPRTARALIESVAICSAVAERSGDTAFSPAERQRWKINRVKRSVAAPLCRRTPYDFLRVSAAAV
jgi:glutathione S-transferase